MVATAFVLAFAAAVVAAAIVVAVLVEVGSTLTVVGALVGWTVAGAAVTVGFALLLPPVLPLCVGVAASTMDGLSGDGVCTVPYGAVFGVSHGAEFGVYDAPTATPADMVTKAASTIPAWAVSARPLNHVDRRRLVALIPPIRLTRVRSPPKERTPLAHVLAAHQLTTKPLDIPPRATVRGCYGVGCELERLLTG